MTLIAPYRVAVSDLAGALTGDTDAIPKSLSGNIMRDCKAFGA